MDDEKIRQLKEYGHYYSVPRGISMKPMLKNRENVVDIVPITTDLKKYDLALYFRPSANQYVLHRILGVENEYYIFYGDNCWQKERIPKEAVVGVAAQFRWHETWIPVTNLWYQMYVHLWCDFLPVRRVIFRVRDGIKRRFRKNHS